MSDACIIIPARYASTRYPGKPLVALTGAGGVARSLLERSVIAARAAVAQAGGDIPLYVATDDGRIADEAERIGAPVILTSDTCRNGTERVAEAVATAGITAPIVVNLQGDAPLTPPQFVTALIAAMRADAAVQMATPVLRCDAEALENFLADRRAGRVGATTVVSDRQGRALYFSKEVIPYTAGHTVVEGVVPVFHHVGLYAYRPETLAAYIGWDQGPLERLEGLEQLRFLENGHPVTTSRSRPRRGVLGAEQPLGRAADRGLSEADGDRLRGAGLRARGAEDRGSRRTGAPVAAPAGPRGIRGPAAVAVPRPSDYSGAVNAVAVLGLRGGAVFLTDHDSCGNTSLRA